MPAKTTEKGEIGEAMVIADLMRQGHDIAIRLGAVSTGNCKDSLSESPHPAVRSHRHPKGGWSVGEGAVEVHIE